VQWVHSGRRTVLAQEIHLKRANECHPRLSSQFMDRAQLEASSGFFRDDDFIDQCDITINRKAAKKELMVQECDMKRLGVVCDCKDVQVLSLWSGVWIREAFIKFFLGCFRV
jgi:hypothetical protein